MKYLTNIGHVALRELDILIRKNRIYGFCSSPRCSMTAWL